MRKKRKSSRTKQDVAQFLEEMDSRIKKVDRATELVELEPKHFKHNWKWKNGKKIGKTPRVLIYENMQIFEFPLDIEAKLAKISEKRKTRIYRKNKNELHYQFGKKFIIIKNGKFYTHRELVDERYKKAIPKPIVEHSCGILLEVLRNRLGYADFDRREGRLTKKEKEYFRGKKGYIVN